MAEEQKEQAATQAVKKDKTILFVVIGVAVVLILLIALLIVLVLSQNKESHPPAEHEAVVEEVQPQPEPNKQAGTKVATSSVVSGRGSDWGKIGPILEVGDKDGFKINLLTQTGKKVLIVKVSIELDKPETQPEVETKLPIISDTIIEILSSKSVEEVATTKGKNRVKDEIVQRLNELLIDGSIKNIFFTHFLIG
ncbi:flagellar basal body-associated FliL family protein [Helicobacter sp. 23-1048]